MLCRFPLVVRIFSVLIAGFLVASPAAAQNRGTLFKASADGNAMYLYGTIHASNPDYYPTDPVLMQAIEQAPALYTESVDTPGMFHAVAETFSLFGEPTYKALSADSKKRLAIQLNRANISKTLGFRLQSVVMLEAVAKAACPEAKQSQVNVDEHLVSLAQRHGVLVKGLEDAELTRRLVDNMSLAVKVSLVESWLDRLEKPDFCERQNLMRQGWLSADPDYLDATDKLMQADLSLAGRYTYENLVRGRDARMAEKLFAMLPRQDKIVVIVDATHLAGKGSIVELLRAKGVTVEKLY
jgi:uncharacterized protein YbaP (TraB family)